MRVLIAVATSTVLLAGCGGAATATGDFPMTTNRGVFRIDARTHAVAKVRGTVTASHQSAGVGTFLDILSTGPGRLLGSGHPDVKGQLPPYLGLIVSDERSRDGGERWGRVGTVPGEPRGFKALAAERLDLALSDGTIAGSEDGGRSWKTTFRP
jgi:hypothetical protein